MKTLLIGNVCALPLTAKASYLDAYDAFSEPPPKRWALPLADSGPAALLSGATDCTVGDMLNAI